jgi:membrane protease YdiL (CAAX protease family)
LLQWFIALFLALPYFVSHQSTVFGHGAYTIFTKIIGPPLEAAILVALALLILGRAGRADARESVQLPEPRYALYAFLLPIGITCLLSFSDYLIDRANWAIYFFDQSFPPQFASHFNLTRAWDPWLLLMVFGAFAEEIVFRGVLLERLMSRYGFHRGIFLTGLVWGAYHFRSDSYSGLSVGGVFFNLADRILMCLAMNYVLAWMTLRWRSIIPAGIAHTVSNILVVAGITEAISWSSELRTVEWAVVAVLLFRYWPLPQAELVEAGDPPPHLETAI